ncbi:MAG: hypothetical protein M1383_03460 [Patescibacteria group bacterium]|nr:hypothetical protein [Patescibacteria group bacterium]
MTVGICGWYGLWFRKAFKEVGATVLWDAQQRDGALQKLCEQPPDLLLVWQSWGEEFVRECKHRLGDGRCKVVIISRTILSVGDIEGFLEAGAYETLRIAKLNIPAFQAGIKEALNSADPAL